MRVLWLACQSPWPADGGGKIRLFNLARTLLERGHHVDIWVIGQDEVAWPTPYPRSLTLRRFSAKPRRTPKHKLDAFVNSLPEVAWSTRTPAVLEALRQTTDRSYDVVVLQQAHLGGVAPELTRADLPWVLNSENIEWWLTWQISQRTRKLRTRCRLMLDAMKYRVLEKELVGKAAAVVAVSSADRDRFRALRPSCKPVVHPNGVDLRYFSWADHVNPSGANLLMTGTLGFFPNFDAARWLRQKVLPLVRRRIPEATVTLVGGGVIPEVEALHDPA